MNEHKISAGWRMALASLAAMPVLSSYTGLAHAQYSAIEEVMVTATRREESLQEVPISITAITSEGLERAGIANTRQLTQTVPSLNFSRANTAFQPVIRGVGTRGNSAGDEANVAVYIDGVYQVDLSGLSFDLVNIERVEVLRGPQGTLFGRNSTGGLINVITSDPSHDTRGKVSLRYGRFNERGLQGYVTTGLTDKLAMDLAVMTRKDEGYIRDLVNGGDKGDRHSSMVRSKLLFEPTDSSRLLLTASFSDTKDASSKYDQPFKGNTAARSLANNPNVLLASKPWTTALTADRDVQTRQYALALEGSIDFDTVTFESTTSYQNTKTYIETDEDGTPLNLQQVAIKPVSDYLSQEFRLLSNTSSDLQWITGVFLFTGTAEFDPARIMAGGNTVQTFNTEQKPKSVAVFGEATYEFSPDWLLTTGLRYSWEGRDFKATAYTGSGAVAVVGGIPQQVDDDADFDEWTYRVSLQRRFGHDASVFASYSRGFKSGVFNAFGANPLSKPTEPEILDAFEVGFKSDPLSWLRLNGAVFYYDYDQIQLTARDSNGLNLLLNAASAELKGAELESTFGFSNGLNVRAYATYLDAKYKKFPNAVGFQPILQDQTAQGYGFVPVGNASLIVDASGNRMMRAPKFTFGISADYEHVTSVGTFGAATNVFRSASYYWDVTERLEQPAYVQVNGELSWTPTGSPLRVSLWGQNLTNAKVYQQLLSSALADMAAFERPRSYGMALQYEF